MINIKMIQQRIQEALKNSGMTQKKLAEKLNICQQSVSHYIKGDIMPALDTLANICIILDLDANEILCIDTYRNIPCSSLYIADSFNNNAGNISIKK